MRVLYLAWDEKAWRGTLVNALRRSPHTIRTAYLLRSPNKYMFAIETLYKAARCDVLLADYASDMGFGATRLRFLHRKPVVIYARGGDVDYHDPKFKTNVSYPQLHFAITKADLILCVSNYVKRCILDLWPHTQGKLRLVYNGVDLTRFHPLPHPPGFNIISVGNLIKRKGFDVLIQAMAIVSKEFHEAHLHIVGRDTEGYAVHLRRLVRELELEEHVSFAGGVPDSLLPRLYAESDLFVHAPWHEPFGVVNIEAMASGLPIIATRVGGIPEIVPSKFLVPPGNPQMLAERICDVLGLPREERRELGEQNIRIVRERFDIKVQAHGVLSALKETLTKHE